MQHLFGKETITTTSHALSRTPHAELSIPGEGFLLFFPYQQGALRTCAREYLVSICTRLLPVCVHESPTCRLQSMRWCSRLSPKIQHNGLAVCGTLPWLWRMPAWSRSRCGRRLPRQCHHPHAHFRLLLLHPTTL